jgi:hypothetical protein
MSTTFVMTQTFSEGLQRFSAATGQTIEPVMRDLMGLLVKKCYDWTPPQKRSSGQGKVGAEVGRVIDSTESDRLLEMLYKRFGAVHITDQEMTGIGGKKWRINNLTIDPSGSTLEQAHNARRNSSGKVLKGSGHVVLTTDAKRRAYTKQVQKRVGKMKAGWAGPLAELGKSVPAWVSTAASLSGKSGTVGKSSVVTNLNTTQMSGFLEAQNATPYANDSFKKIADAHKYIEKWIAGKHFQRWLDQAIDRHNPKGSTP